MFRRRYAMLDFTLRHYFQRERYMIS